MHAKHFGPQLVRDLSSSFNLIEIYYLKQFVVVIFMYVYVVKLS